MLDSQFRLPVFLQRIDANFASFGHIRMEDFGSKEAFRRRRREVWTQDESTTKLASLKWSALWPINISQYIADIIIVNMHNNPLRRIQTDRSELFQYFHGYCRGQIFVGAHVKVSM